MKKARCSKSADSTSTAESRNPTLAHAAGMAADGLWRWNIETEELRVQLSEALRKRFGFHQEGKPNSVHWWRSRVHPHDREKIAATVQTHLHSESVFELECRLKTRAGRYRWFLVRGQSVRNEQSQSVAMVGFVLDISERKKRERKLATEKQTDQAASQAKNRVLANMSREIIPPMNGVMGMSSLLLQTKLNSEQQEYAEIIQKSADALLKILNDILDFSKIEAGKLTIEPIPFDLRVSVEEVAHLFVEKAAEINIELILHYDSDTPTKVIGDPGRCRQILTNLVGNAVKFTEQGHVLIDVRTVECSESDITLKISVEDTGAGIPKNKQRQIFEKFSQGDTKTARTLGSAGLGLPISKQLIEMMGGELGMTSQPETGSTFFFTLKLALDRAADKAPLPAADLTGVRTLLVDEKSVNRRILTEQTRSWGMLTDACGSGEEALQKLKAARQSGQPYQMVIIDYQMPGMDGEILGRQIKSDPNLQDAVTVMFTSVAKRGDVQRMRKAGFAAYLPKPLHHEELLQVLTTVWGAKLQGIETDIITRHTLAESAAAHYTHAATPGTQKTVRVLLVEDNIVNQKVATRMLERLGCWVDIAANGKEAVQKFQDFPYDIIFMDCQMPEMDGCEATAEIRRLEAADEQRTPIIAMPTHAMKGAYDKYLGDGMDDYIAKPIEAERFELLLKKWTTMDAKHERPNITLVTGVIEQLQELEDSEDPGFLAELLQSYLDRVTQDLLRLSGAIANRDNQSVIEAVHSLKGSSGNIGARHMTNLCNAMESYIKAEDNAGIESLFHELQREFETVKHKLTSGRRPVRNLPA